MLENAINACTFLIQPKSTFLLEIFPLATMSGEKVKLYIYDLSKGLARQMSMSLTGKQIDGIWHTSVVVYHKEFFFGQGIMTSVPGGSHHGQPLEVVDMGETYLPEEVIIDYIESQRNVFTPESYHLLDFNCNTFSENLCQFLTGRSIPAHITGLPAEFLNTPFGQSMLPMIEGMFGQSQARPPAPVAAPPAPVSSESLGMLQDISSAALSAAPPQTPKPIQVAQNLSSLERWIESYKATAVFFTSAGCGPCRMIKPDFERLVEEKNSSGTKIKILGVIVDTSVAYDAAAKYGVRATPTFMFFHKGEKLSEFKGANFAELQSSMNLLLFTAYPPHPHRKIVKLRSIFDLPNKPVLYATPGKVDMVFGKLNAFLEEYCIDMNEYDKTVLAESKKIMQKENSSTFIISHWADFTDKCLEKLPSNQQFPLLDVFRTVLLTQSASDYYTKDCSQLVRILENGYKHTPVSKATILMTLRVACNLFAHNNLTTTYFTSSLPESHRASLTQLLINSLLSADSQVRQTAASLAFNCSTVIAEERLKKEKDDGYLSGMAEQDDDDWQIEIVSAVMDVLAKETDEEVVHRLLAAISKFLFLAPTETSSIAELVGALDIKGVIEAKKAENILKTPSIIALAQEINLLVNA
ncbi:PPPDE putative peptidase domain-containing protein [Dichotomocladium elegans]|nr:PPPDE putative peptidase domain-containing protein [Dichotomocladium elegans]